MSWFDEHRDEVEQQLKAEAERQGVQYDPSDLAGIERNTGYGGGSTEQGVSGEQALRNAFDNYEERANNTPGEDRSGEHTGQSWVNAAGQQGVLRQASLAPMAGGGGGSSYGAMMDGWGSDFGLAPAPFGETYTPLARPSYLQGQYVPGQWGETFAAPEKPGVLQTPYALPTQAELEASPGYLSGQTAAQRGMERSAAAKGTILSGGFVGRALPRAMNEYAGTAYGNLVGQTLGARQQQQGEYQGDVSNAFAQYQQRYGQFADAEGLKLGARNTNEAAYQGDESANLTGYKTRYGAYLDQAGMKRQSENDLWSRNRDLSDLSLRAAALARPY